MDTTGLGPALADLLAELTTGTPATGGFVLNRGDAGLLAALDKLSAAEASQASQGGGTIAAHAAHLAYGLSLMNSWAADGGNPFAGARWHEAWLITEVDGPRWQAIRSGLRSEALRWQQALRTPREAPALALKGMIGSVVHLGYHMGAIRQVLAAARGPQEPTMP